MEPNDGRPIERRIPIRGAALPLARQFGLDQLGGDTEMGMSTTVVPVALVGDLRRARFQSWGQRWTMNQNQVAVAAVQSVAEFVGLPGCELVIEDLHASTTGGNMFGWVYALATQITANLANSTAFSIDPAGIPVIGQTGTAPAVVSGPGALGGVITNISMQSPIVLYGGQRLAVYTNVVNVPLSVSSRGRLVRLESGHDLRQDSTPPL